MSRQAAAAGADHRSIEDRVRETLEFVELEHTLDKFPSELSGGMRRRVGIARAVVTEPALELYDSPTAGLDPDSADEFCRLLRSLHHELGLTVVMVTHDLDTLCELSTRIAVVAEKKVIVSGTAREVMAYPHPFIHDFFLGERGQRATALLSDTTPKV